MRDGSGAKARRAEWSRVESSREAERGRLDGRTAKIASEAAEIECLSKLYLQFSKVRMLAFRTRVTKLLLYCYPTPLAFGPPQEFGKLIPRIRKLLAISCKVLIWIFGEFNITIFRTCSRKQNFVPHTDKSPIYYRDFVVAKSLNTSRRKKMLPQQNVLLKLTQHTRIVETISLVKKSTVMLR